MTGKWRARQLRETISAVIVLELFLKGVHFDSSSIWAMPFDHNNVSRTFRALIDAGIVSKSPIRGKYRFTDTFAEMLKQDVTKNMPRELFIHYPDLRIFDLAGIEQWTEAELAWYTERLRERWLIRTRQLAETPSS